MENIPTITDERAKKLLRWKEDRNRKKRLEDTKKKPVFKVGIVHHSFYSPVTKCNTVPTTTVKSSNQIKHPNDTKKRITRATEKRLLAKAKAAAQKAAVARNIVSVSLTKPLDIKKPTPDIKTHKSFAPNSHKFRPPSGLPKLPLFGAVAMEETPSEKGDFFQNKPEFKTQDTNNQKDISEELDTQNLGHNADTATTLKNSVNSRLSSNKQKLNESACNSNTTVSELEKKKLLLSEHNIQESFEEEKSLPNNINVETPVQKTSVTDKSSEKENCNEDLIIFSPYLTLSRGKKNARKEQMLRLGISNSPSDEIPTKDTVMKNLNISVEEEERTAQYFKFLLNKETNRLKELCTKWLNIRKDVPEDAMYEITQAVGQTNLLINKKFDRFRRLVLDCETGMGQMLVTCKDLQGFWEMTCMEVKDCDFRFEKLEQRRKRDWQEEEQLTIVKPSMKKRMTTKKQIVSSKPSSLRSLILAARRKKMAETSNIEDILLQDTSTNKDHFMSSPSIKKSIASKEDANTRCNTRKSKSIDGNGFKSTPAKRDSFKGSLTKLEKVQFSDTIKRIKSPLAVMKISQMCKTPEVQLDDTISYINSDQTPGKSILKKSEEMVNKEIRIKSTHKVIFDDEVALTEVSDDEETQNKRSLAAAMKRIDSLDLDDLSPTECINAGKRLEFETEDSDNSNNQDFEFLPSEVPTQLKEKESISKLSVCNIDSNVDSLNNITSAMSFKKISPKYSIKTKSPRKSLRRQSRRKSTINNDMEVSVINNLSTTPLQTNFETFIISDTTIDTENIEQESNLEIRTLRNRIITTNDTPKINNKMNKMVSNIILRFLISIFKPYDIY